MSETVAKIAKKLVFLSKKIFFAGLYKRKAAWYNGSIKKRRGVLPKKEETIWKHLIREGWMHRRWKLEHYCNKTNFKEVEYEIR